ncbi:MAG: pyrroloquinoline quinone biosynthesis peptide chaperone PqqD [Acidobacteria bacterium]|nr:pyrroloquinoline quinone biosynthesis peptide chaperone PqqD [Acidobacteriota bacterium]
MPLESSSQPRLATGCRWAGEGENRTIVFPEGALGLEQTARAVLELCDGKRTFDEIVRELERAYDKSDPATIRRDAARFLERLWQKKVVEF